MKIDYIKALGNLLGLYYSDLTYIRNFQRYKISELNSKEYLEKTSGTFKSFINEFRVARNVDKDKTDVLLKLTIDWILKENSTNVDGFAKHLKQSGITHGKIMTSLASKILFLNNPWEILPIDNLTKKTIGLHNNNYSQYLQLVKEFREKNLSEIRTCLDTVNQHLTIIEESFNNEIVDLKTIRLNRFIDKILWTIGQQK